LPQRDESRFKDKPVNAVEQVEHVASLVTDGDVTKKSGIYRYLPDDDKKLLNPSPVYMRNEACWRHAFRCSTKFDMEGMDACRPIHHAAVRRRTIRCRKWRTKEQPVAGSDKT
jgi:hypothetical protein